MEKESIRVPHEYLKSEDYYETKSISAGRSNYYCDFCGKLIRKGTPSEVHTFYPEFQGERTHPKCSKEFLESLRLPSDEKSDADA